MGLITFYSHIPNRQRNSKGNTSIICNFVSRIPDFWLLLCLSFIYVTREYSGLLRQSLKFREIASSHSEKCYFSSPRDSLYVWDHNSKMKAVIKKVKTCGPPPWSILPNDIHACEVSPSRNCVTNKGGLKYEPFYIVQRKTKNEAVLMCASLSANHPPV